MLHNNYKLAHCLNRIEYTHSVIDLIVSIYTRFLISIPIIENATLNILDIHNKIIYVFFKLLVPTNIAKDA